MTATTSKRAPELSIGALSRATGIPVETLRTWERRYGFPKASRKPSGHRLYGLGAIPRLRRVVLAIAHGHRPADVMRLEDPALDALLATIQGMPPPAEPPRTFPAFAQRAPGRIRDLMVSVASYDALALQAALELAATRATPVTFLQDTVTPLMHEIGKAWKAGNLQVRHEHFAAARVGDFLREMRRRLEPRGRGPQIALGVLPGDAHEIGLLMVAVVVAASGWRGIYLGPETPAAQLVSLANDAALDAVAVSVSPTAPQPATRAALRELSAGLPPRVTLLIGGAGAPERLPGARALASLEGLERWLAGHLAG